MSSQTFTLFPALPTELRQLVWLFSLPGPRTIVPFTVYNTEFFHTPNKAPEDHSPTTLQITRESRAVALRYYSNWYNAAAFGFQYIDFNIDTICFKVSDFEVKEANRWPPQAQTALLRLSKRDLWTITKLELTFVESENFANKIKAWILKWLLGLFLGVREFDVVWVCRRIMEERGRMNSRDTCEKWVKDEVDLARELGKGVLEEIEGKREGGWKAPVLSVRWSERLEER